MQNGKIVGDFRTLKALERAGFVQLNGDPNSRERHWTGASVRVLTVSEGSKPHNWSERFKHRGHEYQIQYFDGCFKPFVVRLDIEQARPRFI
jgi:hypothetical protein